MTDLLPLFGVETWWTKEFLVEKQAATKSYNRNRVFMLDFFIPNRKSGPKASYLPSSAHKYHRYFLKADCWLVIAFFTSNVRDYKVWSCNWSPYT